MGVVITKAELPRDPHPTTTVARGSVEIKLDSLVAGVVQDLWSAGVETSESCQGTPGREHAYVGFLGYEEAVKLDGLLQSVSNGNWIEGPEKIAMGRGSYLVAFAGEWTIAPLREGLAIYLKLPTGCIEALRSMLKSAVTKTPLPDVIDMGKVVSIQDDLGGVGNMPPSRKSRAPEGGSP